MSTSTQSIREIVARQSSAAGVLVRFDIDLSAQADESLHQACAELQLSVDQVLEKLADAEMGERGAAAANPADLSTSRLIQHIVRVHHQCVRQELPRLAEMAQKLADKHGDRAPELRGVATLLEKLRASLSAHIQREEQVLFPYIAQMDQDAMIARSPAQARFHSVAQPISIMERDHESARRAVAELDRLTHGFEPPTWACPTHIALFGGLRAFQADLERHVYLENDVLFPRAAEMEGVLSARS
ncbi:MAG TPA: hemerythrin domain-containing protein [Terracidiphilus sp.]|nr:hemerythrin domain-containing protein [Terracidiphilus sp.]